MRPIPFQVVESDAPEEAPSGAVPVTLYGVTPGGGATWDDLEGKPEYIAAGSSEVAARQAVGLQQGDASVTSSGFSGDGSVFSAADDPVWQAPSSSVGVSSDSEAIGAAIHFGIENGEGVTRIWSDAVVTQINNRTEWVTNWLRFGMADGDAYLGDDMGPYITNLPDGLMTKAAVEALIAPLISRIEDLENGTGA